MRGLIISRSYRPHHVAVAAVVLAFNFLHQAAPMDTRGIVLLLLLKTSGWASDSPGLVILGACSCYVCTCIALASSFEELKI